MAPGPGQPAGTPGSDVAQILAVVRRQEELQLQQQGLLLEYQRLVGAATAGAAELAEALAGAGDGVMVRIRTHVAGAGFHLAEQLDRGTGNPMSAADLTWSYATVLKAVHARAQYHGVQQGNATAVL